MNYIEFSDRLIPYRQFLNDLSDEVVRKLRISKDDPEFVSQRKAFAMFGRANVERWRREGRIEPAKRLGKLEYRTAELRYLQGRKQDYFEQEE